MLDALLIVELLALGAFAGFLAGLLGIGGGMLMVPALTIVFVNRGVDPGDAVKAAIATAMTTILFTSVSSVRAHHRRGAVDWGLVRRFAPGLVVGGLIAGAGVFALVRGRWLALFFAAFVSVSALQMITGRRPRPSRRMPGAVGTAAAGAGAGFLSGLVGAGGAAVTVPFMTWCNVPMHTAVATSAALGFPIAAANTVGYVIAGWRLPAALPGMLGYIHLPALATIAAASMVLAPLGARCAHTLDTGQLKRAFALLLLALAGYMTWRALAPGA